MSKKYNNPEFNELYQNFLKMYDQEGDVYGTLRQSIEEDLKSKMIPSSVHKTVIHQILDEASVEYFIKEITVLPLNDNTFKDEFKFI